MRVYKWRYYKAFNANMNEHHLWKKKGLIYFAWNLEAL
jgi:hypothetical protein